MPVLARYPHGGEVKVTAPHPTDTPGYAPPTPQKFERLQECERIQCGQLYHLCVNRYGTSLHLLCITAMAPL